MEFLKSKSCLAYIWFPDALHGVDMWQSLKRSLVNNWIISLIAILQQEGYLSLQNELSRTVKYDHSEDRGSICVTRVGRVMRLKIDLQTNISTAQDRLESIACSQVWFQQNCFLIVKQSPFWAYLVARVRKRKRLQCLVNSLPVKIFC